VSRTATAQTPIETIAEGAIVLRGFVESSDLLPEIERIAAAAPFRHLRTPGGGTMSVAMTNCGAWGWHSDPRGYRYVTEDSLTGRPWPAMPAAFATLARTAAAQAGFDDFAPDACLINQYQTGAQMGAHRDHDELDMRHPIVSVSMGVPAVFLWYGAKRAGSPQRFVLDDGDVVVWGGVARAAYHGVRKLAAASHLLTGPLRYNLTFRRAY